MKKITEKIGFEKQLNLSELIASFALFTKCFKIPLRQIAIMKEKPYANEYVCVPFV